MTKETVPVPNLSQWQSAFT